MPWSFSQLAVWQHYLWRFLREIVKKLKLPDKALRTLSLSLSFSCELRLHQSILVACKQARAAKSFSRHDTNRTAVYLAPDGGFFCPPKKPWQCTNTCETRQKKEDEEKKKYAPFCSFAVHFVSGITVINIINATHVLSQLVQVLTVIHDWWKTICYAASSAGSRVNREERKIL